MCVRHDSDMAAVLLFIETHFLLWSSFFCVCSGGEGGGSARKCASVWRYMGGASILGLLVALPLFGLRGFVHATLSEE